MLFRPITDESARGATTEPTEESRLPVLSTDLTVWLGHHAS
jgi:hypothetical protein